MRCNVLARLCNNHDCVRVLGGRIRYACNSLCIAACSCLTVAVVVCCIFLYFFILSANWSNALSIANNRIHCVASDNGIFGFNMRNSSLGFSLSIRSSLISFFFLILRKKYDQPHPMFVLCIVTINTRSRHCKHACSKAENKVPFKMYSKIDMHWIYAKSGSSNLFHGAQLIGQQIKRKCTKPNPTKLLIYDLAYEKGVHQLANDD